jgi:hypothetical protein
VFGEVVGYDEGIRGPAGGPAPVRPADGSAEHDGGAPLGPRRPCRGATTGRAAEAGNDFTLEPGVTTEAGFVGLEEDVPGTPQGCAFLSSFQRELLHVDLEAG